MTLRPYSPQSRSLGAFPRLWRAHCPSEQHVSPGGHHVSGWVSLGDGQVRSSCMESGDRRHLPSTERKRERSLPSGGCPLVCEDPRRSALTSSSLGRDSGAVASRGADGLRVCSLHHDMVIKSNHTWTDRLSCKKPAVLSFHSVTELGQKTPCSLSLLHAGARAVLLFPASFRISHCT